MNQSELIKELSERTHFSQYAIKKVLEMLVEITTEKLKGGDSVTIHGKSGNDNAVIISVLEAQKK